MRKLFADGKITRVERKLLKNIKKEYPSADGKMWAQIDSITADMDEEFGTHLTFHVSFGRDGSEKYNFTHNLSVMVSDGNADFIAGQIVGAIQVIEERLGW